MKLPGSDIVVECLLEQGVDTVFGYPGGWILNVYDALYRYSDKIRHVLTAHEQGASHAADGYARSTGKTGVVMATAGPGATNLVTGIANAYMDSIPLVAITCNVNRGILGKDSFQEIDIVGVTTPITKHNFIVKRSIDIASTIRRAFEIAQSGRKGPVLVDITKDATAELAEYEKYIPKPIVRQQKEIDNGEIENAVRLIEEAERPLMFVGGGVISSSASSEVIKMQELIDCPVAHSMMGLGAFPRTHEMSTGMLGMHGTKPSSMAIKNCDLLIAIGTRFSDRVTCNTDIFARNAKVLHIEIDRAEINKNIKVDGFVVGDAKAVVSEINGRLKPRLNEEWTNQVAKWKKEFPLKQNEDAVLPPQYIINKVNEMTNGDAIICTEVGQHQMWTVQNYPFTKPGTLVSSGGLGAMGFGLGACIGAQVGNPDKKVINIAGDGCFHMNMNELSTAAKNNLPIIEIVMNNNVLGMVRQWQKLFYDKRFSNTTLDKKTNYDMLAEALGAKGYTVTNRDEFNAAFAAALSETDTPTVINCLISCDTNVVPMVPPGQSIEEPILEM